MLEEKIFAEGAAREVKAYLAPEFSDVECTVMERKKNNNIALTGICFQRPGQQAAPLVYVGPFYDMVKNGEPKEEVLAEIARQAENGMRIREIPEAGSVVEYAKAKEYLSVRIVNTRANRQRLSHMPHREVEDLSLTVSISFPLDGGTSSGSIEVTNEIMDAWGMDEETVFRQAWENTDRNQPPVMQDMGAMFGMADSGNLLAEDGNLAKKPEGVMFVLTNREKQYGASAIVRPEVMEKVGRVFPEGFYILPSSIHETLIVPKSAELAPKELGNLVRGVNQTAVSREEVLSDRVYEYDRESGKIRQVPESIEKGRAMER